MVTTNVSPRLPAQSLSAGGIPKPGTLNAGSKSGTSNLTERSQSKASVDSVKSNGSAGGKKTSDSGIAGHHDMEERTPYKHGGKVVYLYIAAGFRSVLTGFVDPLTDFFM